MAKRTIRKRMRKNKTIRKVMRGCNGRRRHNRTKVGGTGEVGKVEVHQYQGGAVSPQANQNIAGGTSNLLQAQQYADNQAPTTAREPVKSSMVPAPVKSQQGGSRTRHHRRRLRYKKSVARKSRHA
jgi:hypothetical protein